MTQQAERIETIVLQTSQKIDALIRTINDIVDVMNREEVTCHIEHVDLSLL